MRDPAAGRACICATVAAAVLLLAGCAEPATERLLGTLEWDRIAVVAEATEPVIELAVGEGQPVAQGDLLLRLDPRRIDAQLREADARVRVAAAQRDRVVEGARNEAIAAAAAQLRSADARARDAEQERSRRAEMRARGLVAQAELDRADNALRAAQSDAAAARAALDELRHGSRVEDVAEAEATMQAAQAAYDALQLRRQRLDVTAPRAGRVDALPYRLGDQPLAGADVVSLLAGDAPYARIYVPASRRLALAAGARCSVWVEGDPVTERQAIVRSIAADPAFTPYFALTGDDASRLAYRAELVLEREFENDGVDALPAGLPVQAECDGVAR